MLPLSLEDLFNYTTLILKFCTNKPIWALLLRQVFFGGGKAVEAAPHCQKKAYQPRQRHIRRRATELKEA
jgi:hypothetical protein